MWGDNCYWQQKSNYWDFQDFNNTLIQPIPNVYRQHQSNCGSVISQQNNHSDSYYKQRLLQQIHFRLTKCINKPCANTERNRFFSSVCFHTLDHVKRQQRRAKSEERRGTPIGRNSLNTRRELVPCASPGLSYGLSLATGLHQRQGLDGFENYLPR